MFQFERRSGIHFRFPIKRHSPQGAFQHLRAVSTELMSSAGGTQSLDLLLGIQFGDQFESDASRFVKILLLDLIDRILRGVEQIIVS